MKMNFTPVKQRTIKTSCLHECSKTNKTNESKNIIKKTVAFTLAEVLITLVVIGIFTAITIGTVGKMTPDKEKMLFRKTYQTIERTVHNLVNDENFYSYDEDNNGFSNTTAITFDGQNYEGTTKFRELIKAHFNINENETSTAEGGTTWRTGTISVRPNNDSDSHFFTTEGIEWIITNTMPAAIFFNLHTQRREEIWYCALIRASGKIEITEVSIDGHSLNTRERAIRYLKENRTVGVRR